LYSFVCERFSILALLPVAGCWAILAAMLMGVLLVLCGYALGSIPTGLLVGWAWGTDIRRVGSGNIGTANVLRAAGKWAAIVTMLGDMLKGLVPVVVARLLTENEWVIAAVALAAVAGHCWPVFLRFKGGKGVATGAGTSIGLAPVVGLLLFAFWWAVVLMSRYTSLGAIAVMVVSPIAFLLSGQPLPYVLYTIIGGALVLWRHRENAQALIKGTERKIGETATKEQARVR
jgi:glycerol-3-phosphate acyltransferase PlsY